MRGWRVELWSAFGAILKSSRSDTITPLSTLYRNGPIRADTGRYGPIRADTIYIYIYIYIYNCNCIYNYIYNSIHIYIYIYIYISIYNRIGRGIQGGGPAGVIN